jgi:hypothetical protein
MDMIQFADKNLSTGAAQDIIVTFSSITLLNLSLI